MRSLLTIPTRGTLYRSVRSAGSLGQTGSSTSRLYPPSCWILAVNFTASGTTPNTTTSTPCRRKSGSNGSISRTSRWCSTPTRFHIHIICRRHSKQYIHAVSIKIQTHCIRRPHKVRYEYGSKQIGKERNINLAWFQEDRLNCVWYDWLRLSFISTDITWSYSTWCKRKAPKSS